MGEDRTRKDRAGTHRMTAPVAGTPAAAACLLAASLAAPGPAAARGDVEARLLRDVAAELGRVARENSHELDEASPRLFSPPENVALPANSLGFVLAGGGLAAGAGLAAAAALGPLAGAGVLVVAGAGILGVRSANDDGGGLLGPARRFDHMLFADHLRLGIGYSVFSEGGGWREGFCLLFVEAAGDGETGDFVLWEADECSHPLAFPQREEGRLRIGRDGPDAMDRWMGQTDVVAAGSFPL